MPFAQMQNEKLCLIRVLWDSVQSGENDRKKVLATIFRRLYSLNQEPKYNDKFCSAVQSSPWIHRQSSLETTCYNHAYICIREDLMVFKSLAFRQE